MIITKTPLRISIIGGGTDFESHYLNYGGSVISFAVNKYIYISLNQITESRNTLVKYSTLENVKKVSNLKHPIIKNILEKFALENLDISITSDVISGTGLGSSSAFTVGMIKTIGEFLKQPFDKYQLAELACDIEINQLGAPIGKQDQYASAFGNFNHIKFGIDGKINVTKLNSNKYSNVKIEEVCLAIRIGGKRDANKILLKQKNQNLSGANKHNLIKMKDIADHIAIEGIKSPHELGDLINESWKLKRELSEDVSNSQVEEEISLLIKFGATGAKLLGAGKSGYIFAVFPSKEIRDAFVKLYCNERAFFIPAIDFLGSSIIYNSEI